MRTYAMNGTRIDFPDRPLPATGDTGEANAMTMREKMARAIHDAVPKHFPRDAAVRPWDDEPPRVREPLFAVVDAVLDAMAEPTDGMYEALSATDTLWKNQTSEGVWRTYVQAAKEGK